jgi:hypothetical protein
VNENNGCADPSFFANVHIYSHMNEPIRSSAPEQHDDEAPMDDHDFQPSSSSGMFSKPGPTPRPTPQDDSFLVNDHTLQVWLKGDVGVDADAKGKDTYTTTIDASWPAVRLTRVCCLPGYVYTYVGDLVGRSVGNWLAHQLVTWLAHQLVTWLAHQLVTWLVHQLGNWLVRPSVNWLVHQSVS